jgi:hypothetical protein
MKTRIWRNGYSWKPAVTLARACVVAGFLLCTVSGWAQFDPGGYYGPTNKK